MIEIKTFDSHYKNLSLTDIEGEIWKEVVGYEGLYEVSNLGRVKSVRKIVKRNTGFLVKPEVIKKQKVSKGYLTVALCKESVFKHKKVHILVGVSFIENPQNKPQINHKKGNKLDNRATELEWNTAEENVRHSYSFGLKIGKKGELHPLSKLNDSDIPNIISLRFDKKLTQQAIADMYNVCRATISLITNKKYYSHIK